MTVKKAIQKRQTFETEKKSKARASVLNVIARDKVRLSFRQIEGCSVGFVQNADKKHEK
jgi:hypothetical protein